jgi:predicted DNA-binding transcriptional regulator AlpA
MSDNGHESYGTLLNKAQLAEMLGVKESWISAEVAKYVSTEGEEGIPHLRLGGRKLVRFRRNDIEEWLDTRTQ